MLCGELLDNKIINTNNVINNPSKNIKVELDLSNYATKDDVKNITHVDVSSYGSKTKLILIN